MNEMRGLVDRLNELAYKYYTEDDPIVSDAEYDRLYDRLLELERQSGEIYPDSPTRRVGDAPLKGFETVEHLGRLYSLDKCQSKDELSGWLDKLTAARGGLPTCSVEYKFDGLTINLTYENGLLVRGATRGNGVRGEDVTRQIMTIKSIPLSIPYKGKLEVQGEGIMRLSALSEYNARPDVTPLKNARNAAAGAIKNLDPAITARRKLDVIFYNVNYIDTHFDSGHQMIRFLKDNRFKTSKYYRLSDDKETILAELNNIAAERESLDFLIDGAVIKVDDAIIRDEMGYTEKFPRWAMAFKFEAQEVSTVLKDVVWQVSRTGKLNPLAVLEPVELAGVSVGRATLNNYGDIKRKDIKINSRVFVRRSNDVIPEITGVAEHNANSREILPPERCPACGGEVKWEGAFLKCTNTVGCAPTIVSAMTHFVSKDAMDIDGFSEKTIEALYNKGVLERFVDIYALRREDLEDVDGFRDKKIANVLGAVEKSKHVPLDKFIYALGIPNIGVKAARDLAAAFGDIETLMAAKEEEIVALDDFGDITARCFTEYWRDAKHVAEVRMLLARGVSIVGVVKRVGKLSGLRFVLTGTLPTLRRGDAKKLIEDNGGATSESVSKGVDYVVAGEEAGSKLDKAKKLGVEIIDEAALIKMIDEA